MRLISYDYPLMKQVPRCCLLFRLSGLMRYSMVRHLAGVVVFGWVREQGTGRSGVG